MRLSAVFACLRLLSEAVATLPLDTFRRHNGTRSPYRPRPDYLSFQPPQGRGSTTCPSDAVAAHRRQRLRPHPPRPARRPPRPVVLDPTLVKVTRDQARPLLQGDGRPARPDRPTSCTSRACACPAHREGPVADRLRPRDDRSRPRGATVRLGVLRERRPPVAVIEAEGKMSQAPPTVQGERGTPSHQGVGNAQKVGVLTEGAKLNKVSINPNDAQFLETRQFQVPDVARIFGVPPHLIADASNSTSWGSGLAEQNLAFGQFSLRPWTERIEDGHGRLLTTHGLPDVFVKLNLDALLRASLKDRYEPTRRHRQRFDTINEPASSKTSRRCRGATSRSCPRRSPKPTPPDRLLTRPQQEARDVNLEFPLPARAPRVPGRRHEADRAGRRDALRREVQADQRQVPRDVRAGRVHEDDPRAGHPLPQRARRPVPRPHSPTARCASSTTALRARLRDRPSRHQRRPRRRPPARARRHQGLVDRVPGAARKAVRRGRSTRTAWRSAPSPRRKLFRVDLTIAPYYDDSTAELALRSLADDGHRAPLRSGSRRPRRASHPDLVRRGRRRAPKRRRPGDPHRPQRLASLMYL
jgi:hypothetical protein